VNSATAAVISAAVNAVVRNNSMKPSTSTVPVTPCASGTNHHEHCSGGSGRNSLQFSGEDNSVIAITMQTNDKLSNKNKDHE
jgi:hypothetical protein